MPPTPVQRPTASSPPASPPTTSAPTSTSPTRRPRTTPPPPRRSQFQPEPNSPLNLLAYQFWCACNNIAASTSSPASPHCPAPSLPLTSLPVASNGKAHMIVEDTISTYYNSGNCLSLDDSDGGNASWAEMNATIYEVEYDFFHGLHHHPVRPAQTHESAQQLIYRMMLFASASYGKTPTSAAPHQDSNGSAAPRSAIKPASRTPTPVMPPASALTRRGHPARGWRAIRPSPHRQQERPHRNQRPAHELTRPSSTRMAPKTPPPSASISAPPTLIPSAKPEATRASIEWYRISYCNEDGDMKHRYIPASQEYDGA